MMRTVWLLILLSASFSLTPAQTNSSASSSDVASTNEEIVPAVPDLLAKWRGEKDAKTRRDLGGQILKAMVEFDDTGNEHLNAEIADEVCRDGLPKREIKAAGAPVIVQLNGLKTLSSGEAPKGEQDSPLAPVFRRVSGDRVEAWAGAQGWLFDGQGKLVAEAHVRRHEGNGAAWLGAFLPNGQWITTDLWVNDRQIYAFSKDSKLLWDLEGKEITSKLPPSQWGYPADKEGYISPSVGWARAASSNKQWLVCLGEDYSRGFALIGPDKKIKPLEADANVWMQTYPRSMGPRGGYVEIMVNSDDGKKVMTQAQPAHGSWCGWTTYVVTDRGQPMFSAPLDDRTSNKMVIDGGTHAFGFWPNSDHVYMEIGIGDAPQRVWFFGPDNRYEGEVSALYLGDAAKGTDLLVMDADGVILQASPGKQGPVISGARVFQWADGSRAIPMAIYDDLKCGFFRHGPAMRPGWGSGTRPTDDIVYARW